MASLNYILTTSMTPNAAGQQILPFPVLKTLLEENDNEVEQAIKEAGVKTHLIPEVVRKVLKGGHQLFATLVYMEKVHLITKFLERDTQNIDLDARLPCDIAELQRVLGKPELAKERDKLRKDSTGTSDTDQVSNSSSRVSALNRSIAEIDVWAVKFSTAQYHFVLPTFSRNSSHRTIEPLMKLPFEDEERIGGGGQGDVFKVRLISPYYGPGLPEEKYLVRKEMKASVSSWNSEEDCLAMLRLIDHPNIIELYCSYTYNGNYNFLLPYATGGDLEGIISSNKRPAGFRSDEAFYNALCGLASGLEQLHFYHYVPLGARRFGRHKDLKPKNILVHGSKLILADFGLSKLKEITEESKSTAVHRQDSYVPPEAENLETLDMLPAGRAGDIWAFGCILAVVLTYLKRGAEGVMDFKEARKVTVPSEFCLVTYYTFHAGKNRENEGGKKWLDCLESKGSPAEKRLITLIRSMLRLAPDSRPNAQTVTTKLRFIAVRKAAKNIESSLAKSHWSRHFEFDVECATFSNWLSFLEGNEVAADELFATEAMFTQTLNVLASLGPILDKIDDAAEVTYPVFAPFRRANASLLAGLSESHRRQITSKVELLVLDGHEDIQMPTSASPVAHPNLVLLGSIRQMTRLTNDASPAQVLDKSRVTLDEEVTDAFSYGRLDKQSVVVEKLYYTEDWSGDKGEELFKRMLKILDLLQRRREFRSLPYIGFYHDRDHYMFGLVYDYPKPPPASPSSLSTPLEAVSLSQILKLKVENWEENTYIPLNARLQLALQLARSLFEFHKVKWLHKSISSFNIIFFIPKTSKSRDRIRLLGKLENPYIVGFSRSRPQGNQNYSNKIYHSDRVMNAFHHPEYRVDDITHVSYRPEFDYYSLGLVLLEIGLWQPLEKCFKIHEPPIKATNHALSRRVPFLKALVGRRYSEVVERCLRCNFTSKDCSTAAASQAQSAEVDMEEGFQKHVLDCLTGCVL